MHRFCGPRRIRYELVRRGLVADAMAPSESAVYRCLVRAGLVEPVQRRRTAVRFKRWEHRLGDGVVADGHRGRLLLVALVGAPSTPMHWNTLVSALASPAARAKITTTSNPHPVEESSPGRD
jgi:hypothetical protein